MKQIQDTLLSDIFNEMSENRKLEILHQLCYYISELHVILLSKSDHVNMIDYILLHDECVYNDFLDSFDSTFTFHSTL